MRKWLQTRGREIVALLSDIGGALALVVAAATLIVAAVVGVVLLMLDVFPQPFLTLFVLGMAFLAGGLTLHFLGPVLAPTPHPRTRAPAAGPELNSPYSQAAELQRRHDTATADAETRNRMLAERSALRRIREELLDNKNRIERAYHGETEEVHHLTSQHWRESEAVLLEVEDPAPHEKAREAYRAIETIQNTRYTRDLDNPNVLIKRDFPSELSFHDVRSATDAIDDAAKSLAAAGSGPSEPQ